MTCSYSLPASEGKARIGRAEKGFLMWRIVEAGCGLCGETFSTPHAAFLKKAACPNCVATSLVFDRNQHIGKLPANLQRAYGLNRRGQPRRA